jgi:hypothetical protein
MEVAVSAVIIVVVLALIGYAAFHQWIRHQRRHMIHRERLAAIEKSVELPPLEQEVRRIEWNVQRILLFAGLVWISVGAGTYLALNALVGQPPFHVLWGRDRFGNPMWVEVPIRDGMQWVGAALFGIGVAHLIVYLVGKKGNR